MTFAQTASQPPPPAHVARRAARAVQVTPAATAFARALQELADTTDALAAAVERRDQAGVETATLRGAELVAELAARTPGLTAADRRALDALEVTSTTDRIARGARRNALLLERAWAFDAAILRLLAAASRGAQDGDASALASGTPTYAAALAAGEPAGFLDRSA